MERTLLTLTITVLLMTILCISAAAQGTWTLNSTFNVSDMNFRCVEFVDNDYVIIGGIEAGFTDSGKIYKWKFSTDQWWFANINSGVTEFAIGGDTNFFMYAKVDGNVGSRYTSSLNWRAGITTGLSTGIDLARPVQLAFADPRDGYETLVVGGTVSPSLDAQFQLWEVATHDFRRLRVHTLTDKITIEDLETAKYINEFFAADGDTNADIYGTDMLLEWASGSHNLTGQTVTALAFNWETDSDRLAIGKANKHVQIFGYKSSQIRFILHRSPVTALDFSPTHWDILAATAYDGSVTVWDISSQGGTKVIATTHNGSTVPVGRDIAFSPNGKYLACVNGSLVRIWLNTGGLGAPSANQEPEKSPEATTLLPNFPNPFNPETWIPYQLAQPAEVTVSIHAADGKLVRTLTLGHLPAGVYQEKERAAYWDGKNEQGEPVASGIYFYTLTAGDFSATKKLLIRK